MTSSYTQYAFGDTLKCVNARGEVMIRWVLIRQREEAVLWSVPPVHTRVVICQLLGRGRLQGQGPLSFTIFFYF
jgi:hypothetical protein